MLIKINDVSAMIENYIKASIKADYPNSDLTGTSSVVDLFTKPVTSISEILMGFSKDIELRSLLSNAAEMSKEDMDDLGEGNYMMERLEGSKSFGTAQLKFKTVPDDRNLTIPVGTIFATSSGLRFQVHQTYSFSPEEVALKWSSEDLAYVVEISVESDDVGTQYNIDSGELNTIESSFTSHSVTVINNTAFTGGTDEETNEGYRERIERFIASRTLETAPGYESEIVDNFLEVVDVYVAGYGDPLMERDMVESVTIDGVTFTDRHIGGKVDLYVRGDNVAVDTITFNSLSNRLPLPESISLIDQTSITILNDFNSVDVTDYTVTEDIENDRLIIVVNESLEWDYGDPLTVTYDIDTTDDELFDTTKSENFVVDKTINRLKSPVEAMSSIINKTRDNLYYDVGDGISGSTDYTITYDDAALVGTSNEIADIEIINTEIVNGEEIEINYNYNETINSLKVHFNERENRVVTRDLLFKKCDPVYLHIEFNVKLNDGVSESSTIGNEIFDVISTHFDGKGLGEKVDESDIVHEIYANENLSKIVDYIGVGFTTFHKTLDQTETFTSGVSDGTTIAMEAIQYPVLRYLEINYVA